MVVTIAEKIKIAKDEFASSLNEYKEIQEQSQELIKVTDDIDKTWSGSPLGNHGQLYFRDFEQPSYENQFDSYNGLIYGNQPGWNYKSEDQVKEKIFGLMPAGFDYDAYLIESKRLKDKLRDFHETIYSLVVLIQNYQSLGPTFSTIEKFTLNDWVKTANQYFKRNLVSRDQEAISGGLVMPVQKSIQYYVRDAADLYQKAKDLLSITEKLLTQLEVTRENINIDTEDFIHPDSIQKLESLHSQFSSFDLARLIAYSKEINICFSTKSYFACAMLMRGSIDHVPPIFGVNGFAEVANSRPKSIKKSFLDLDTSLRNIADSFLHQHIRKKETLPNKNHIDFKANFNVFISEIIRYVEENI